MMVVEPKAVDRRESPRLKLPGVAAEIVSAGLPANVLDIGFGGVSIESEGEFKMGEVHTLRAVSPDQSTTAVRVRVRHCRRVLSAARPPRYVTGFEFIDPWCPGDRSAADEFISQVTNKVAKSTRQ